MEVFVARQPILNNNQEICAYELLYRSSNEQNVFSHVDGEQATSDVINSILQIGIEDLSEGKLCFINFTEKLLEGTIPTLFQPEKIVIEVLETVMPNDKIIENCKRLKDLGYKIALDDFEMKSGNIHFLKLLGLADIIKVDIRNTSRPEQLKIIKTLKKYGVEFLAEKVETREEFKQCLRDGYKYFQGYFFSKPVILSTIDVPIQSHSFFIIMKELSQVEPEVNKVAQIIETDLSLTYKLLKLMNSPLLGRLNKIKSIKQAIVLLGFKELKNWVYVLSFRETIKTSNPFTAEVMKMSFTRAKASELVAISTGKRSDSPSYFLTGMLSLIDTLIKQPLEKILNQLPLEEKIKNTLLGNQTQYSDVINLVIAVERADWQEIAKLADKVGIGKQKLFSIYKESMKWAKDVMEEPTIEVQ